jgi:hypothetical protein
VQGVNEAAIAASPDATPTATRVASPSFSPAVDLSPPQASVDWQRLAGKTPFEQAKTMFAGIGILAALLQLLKWLLPAEKKEENAA